MKYKAVIFDMDGTILDTLEDMKICLNYALKMNSFPERSKPEVRSFVGNGIRRLIELAVPENTEENIVDKVYNDFFTYYGEHCNDTTKPYDGIVELIITLRKNGYKTAVVSNKADIAVQKLCEIFFQGLFDSQLGEQEGIRKKPAADSVNKTLSVLGVSRDEAVYVGDSEVDIATAKNAVMDCICVEWGFRDKDFLIEKGGKTFATKPIDIGNICK